MCEKVLSLAYEQQSSDIKEEGREGVVVEIVRTDRGNRARERVSTLAWSLPGQCFISMWSWNSWSSRLQ